MNHSITSTGVGDTKLIGKKIGEIIESGAIIALNGELGSGKTVFAQGIGEGLSVPDKYYITSPTYTLINEYPGKIPFFHVDLYRIEDISDLENIGFYEILDNKSVVAIEWSERLGENFFSDYLAIDFKIVSDNSRIICFKGYGKYGYNCSEIWRYIRS